MKLRKFNTTGICIPGQHYMVAGGEKILKIMNLVCDGCYFTINRARQYGKTTTLGLLEKAMHGEEYVCASISFEGADCMFENPRAFCRQFLLLIQDAIEFEDGEFASLWQDADVVDFNMLSRHISKLCKDKKVVLMIDEVDAVSNNRVFLQFLSMLRSGYLKRGGDKAYTFHSVILAGVYDVKNIKLKLVIEGLHSQQEGERQYNSPWNIATEFDVDMSFSPDEIASMLEDYENDHKTGMDISVVSEEIHRYTSGYPFIVSVICKYIDERLDKMWSVDGVQSAVKILVEEKNTLFDSLSKNLESNRRLYELVYDVLILGVPRTYSINNPTVDLGVRYGIITGFNSLIAVSCKVLEIVICNYFISKDEEEGRQIVGVLQNDVVHGGRFDMELCLRKFAEHYAEVFDKRDAEFLERHGRLLFLSFLKPLINGMGFYHIESHFTDLRRMDVVVDYGRDQFVIELKLWKGTKAQSESYEQLLGYMNSKKMDKGYLLTFDFRKEGNKERKSEWVRIEGKQIFEVIV